MGLDIEPDDLLLLMNSTEGWPAGIYLASLTLRHREDKHTFIESFGQYLIDAGHKVAVLAHRRVEIGVDHTLSGEVVVDFGVNRRRVALDVKLDQGAMKRLDEIWPGPGGPAPEAWTGLSGSQVLRMRGIDPGQFGESSEVAVEGTDADTVLDGECGQVGVGDQVAA